MTPFFATDYSRLMPFVFGIPVAIALLGAFGFIPAARGHWLAPVVATLVSLVGIFLLVLLLKDGGMFLVWLAFSLPLIVGLAVLVTWLRARRTARYTSHPHEPKA